jgi:hypothetical protein
LVPDRNVTVPVGVTPFPVIVAVNVIVEVTGAGLGVTTSVVAGAARFTVSVVAADALPL